MEQADKKILNFLKASGELEQYLHEDGPLTPLHRQTIETTIFGLQTLMQSWTRKHGGNVLAPVTPPKAEGS
jgi:hypothetical protein